jgi:hypothetical protein
VRSLLIALALCLPLGGSAGGGWVAGTCRTIAVTQRAAAFPHARSLQAAVDAASPCDWIVVAPGLYRGPVMIRARDLHLRGLDRNRVIVEGRHRIGDGITVTADEVSIENLTVRNFDRRTPNDDADGTQVAWRGVRGWHGRYLTVYDTGLLGGYGLWASRSSLGGLDRVYASGFADSGLYVGACRDCRAVVEHAVAERNLVGLAATNASGRFVVERSLFRDNAVGASFNSSRSDPPPPQLGTCDAGRNRSPQPIVATTSLARCTVFRDNRVLDNDALDTPSTTASVRPGAGIGVDLLGSEGDLIGGNAIAGNRNVGVLGLELPYDRRPVRFRLAGNRISGNRIRGSRLAVGLAGGHGSVNNCLSAGQGAPTLPADLHPFACSRATTPPLPARAGARVLALVHRLHAQLASHARRRQPAPPPQSTMPAPCAGPPPSPLCRR